VRIFGTSASTVSWASGTSPEAPAAIWFITTEITATDEAGKVLARGLQTYRIA
jgi:hypothetical protein